MWIDNLKTVTVSCECGEEIKVSDITMTLGNYNAKKILEIHKYSFKHKVRMRKLKINKIIKWKI